MRNKYGRIECNKKLIMDEKGVLEQINIAVDNDEWDVVLSLVTPKNVNATINYGGCLLFRAAKSGRRDVVEALLRLGADPNVASIYIPAVWISTRQYDVEITRLLLQAGANVNTYREEHTRFNDCNCMCMFCKVIRGAHTHHARLLVDWGYRLFDKDFLMMPEWFTKWVHDREACRMIALQIMALQRHRKPDVSSGQDMNVLRMIAKQIWSNRMDHDLDH